MNMSPGTAVVMVMLLRDLGLHGMFAIWVFATVDLPTILDGQCTSHYDNVSTNDVPCGGRD
jgi:hypothetical protein